MQISFIGLNPHSTAQGAHPIIAPRLGDRWPCGGREACGFAAQLWFCCLCSLKLWVERLPSCQTFALCTDPGQVVGWISHTYDQAVLLFKTTWRISTGLLAVVVVILGWYALSIRVVSVRPSFVHGSVCCRLFIVLVVCPLVYPWKFPLKWGVSKMRALRQLRPRVCCCFGGCYYCCCFCFLWQSKHAILRDSAIGFWAGPA